MGWREGVREGLNRNFGFFFSNQIDIVPILVHEPHPCAAPRFPERLQGNIDWQEGHRFHPHIVLLDPYAKLLADPVDGQGERRKRWMRARVPMARSFLTLAEISTN